MPFPCLMVRKSDTVTCALEQIATADLPAGDVLIRVAYSSLNYKDALACRGHPGVVRHFPHVPGIDCAGEVVECEGGDFPAGTPVLVTGYDLGTTHWGGFAGYVRVPQAWVVPLPAGLTLTEAMALGTAGFTAAQCVGAITRHGIRPEAGPVAVTGATGGVGSLSMRLLAKLGYEVVAITGKTDQADWLRQCGAGEVLPRTVLADDGKKPLLPARWAAAVDTVGGAPLSALLRGMQHRGCVAACGMAAGNELSLTVYPFILRGVMLAGIDSAQCPYDKRVQIWEKLAGEWKLDQLAAGVRKISLTELPTAVEQMLAGQAVGRVLVQPQPEE